MLTAYSSYLQENNKQNNEWNEKNLARLSLENEKVLEVNILAWNISTFVCYLRETFFNSYEKNAVYLLILDENVTRIYASVCNIKIKY